MRSLRKNHRFTIRRSLVVNEPFGMHECIPYEASRQTPICWEDIHGLPQGFRLHRLHNC